MSEFTEKLNSSELVSNAINEIDKDQADVRLLIDTIRSEFKDWQPPKQLVVVPEDVDKAIKYLKNNTNSTFSDLCDILTNKGLNWLNDFQFKDRRFGFGGLNNKLFILSHLAITGYTVEKEKLYLLKHIDLSEQYKNESVYLYHSRYAKLKHESHSKGADMSKFKQCHFTQSEIDKLNIGSYEQIEVKVEE